MGRPRTSPRIPALIEFFTDGKPNKLCWDYITALAKVVVSKYFYKYLEHFSKDDLAALAVSDAVGFVTRLYANNNVEGVNNARNVLFTRIRNTLSNFVFRSNKLVSTDDEILSHVAVYPKTFGTTSDLIDPHDLTINSIDSFRTICLKTWKLFKTNGATQKYAINNSNDNIEDWFAYSEVKNMKTPCALIEAYNYYTDDQIEALANKLDEVFGQNYFNTLYQLLGDKFLAFLDVFQEDKFTIPSTMLVKHLLTDMSIQEDFDDGLTVDDLANKYSKSVESVQRVLDSREVI